MSKKYKIACFIRIDEEDIEDNKPMSLEEAKSELKHLRTLQSENRYELEEVE